MKKIDPKLQAEIEFIDSIGASFPFENEGEARTLISKGAAISDNAALMIGYELATMTLGQHTAVRLALLDTLLIARPTEALKVAAPVIRCLIRGATLPERTVGPLIEYCRNNKGCYNALGLLSLGSEELEKEAERISDTW